MRTATEIEPVALLVDAQRFIGLDAVDEFALEGLALGDEPGLGVLAAPDFARDFRVARDDLLHLLFDRGQVFEREGLGAMEIVIEAVFDHRADRDLRAGIKLLHRFGEHMRRVVADELQRARILAGDELDLRVAIQRREQIDERAVDSHGDAALGERGRDALGDVEARDAGIELTGRPVRESHCNHLSLLSRSIADTDRRKSLGGGRSGF